LFNVRFITYNLTEGPHPPDTSSLKQVFAGETYAVYENLLCRNYVQLYKSKATPSTAPTLNDLISQETLEQSVLCEKSDSEALIELDVDTEHEVLLVLSQSYYPGWSLAIDDRPAAIHTIEGVLPAIVVPAGSHHVTLRYKRPWYFHTSLAISLTTLIFAIGTLRHKDHRFPAIIVEGSVSHE
ncbi:YfhO family protein, partial [Candidatus Pacearchaeota archaeon]|nr:YfhO family protein [Candidatus Pacearchaeota archaeon]